MDNVKGNVINEGKLVKARANDMLQNYKNSLVSSEES